MANCSELEAVFCQLWQLCAMDQPQPVREYRFHPSRKWRFDFAWPAQRVAVEIDGGQWQEHGGRHATDADREKLNAAAALGWRVLRFSGSMLHHKPDDCMQIVRDCLESVL